MVMQSMETRWLHNPLDSDNTVFYGTRAGISVEHMIRPSNFNMRCNHFHPEYEIYLLLGGRRQFFFDNRSYLAEKGSLAIIDSSQIHMTHSVPDDPDPSYERIILYVHKDRVAYYDRIFPELEMGNFLHNHYGIYALTPEQIQQTTRMFEVLMEELKEPQGKSGTLVDLEIMRFFIEFWRANRPVNFLQDKEGSPRRGKGKYTTAYQVSDYISSHFCEEISLDRLAEMFSVSRSYLSRSFKEVSGFGISEYVNMLRIRRAQDLLAEGRLSISAVSEAVGFENPSYFGRVFQKHLAISPSQYRREVAQLKAYHPDEL